MSVASAVEAVSDNRASTVLAIAVSERASGAIVAPATPRLHASEKVTSVAVKAASVAPDLSIWNAIKIGACAQSTLIKRIENRRTWPTTNGRASPEIGNRQTW